LGYYLNPRYIEKQGLLKYAFMQGKPLHFTKYKGFDPGASTGD
jgi:hypothetical protein